MRIAMISWKLIVPCLAVFFICTGGKIKEISQLAAQKAATFIIFGGSWCSAAEA